MKSIDERLLEASELVIGIADDCQQSENENEIRALAIELWILTDEGKSEAGL